MPLTLSGHCVALGAKCVDKSRNPLGACQSNSEALEFDIISEDKISTTNMYADFFVGIFEQHPDILVLESPYYIPREDEGLSDPSLSDSLKRFEKDIKSNINGDTGENLTYIVEEISNESPLRTSLGEASIETKIADSSVLDLKKITNNAMTSDSGKDLTRSNYSHISDTFSFTDNTQIIKFTDMTGEDLPRLLWTEIHPNSEVPTHEIDLQILDIEQKDQPDERTPINPQRFRILLEGFATIESFIARSKKNMSELIFSTKELGNIKVQVLHGEVLEIIFLSENPDMLSFLRRNSGILQEDLRTAGVQDALLTFVDKDNKEKGTNQRKTPPTNLSTNPSISCHQGNEEYVNNLEVVLVSMKIVDVRV